MLKLFSNKNDLVGVLQFKLEDLKDQELREGWFSVEGESCLKVRVQYLHDSLTLVNDLKSQCDRITTDIEYAINNNH